MQTHIFTTTERAYTASQTDDRIKDGDVLVALDENVVGVLVGAWPVAVAWIDSDGQEWTVGWSDEHVVSAEQDEVSAPGEFHWIADKTWDTFDDGKYKASADAAMLIHEEGL